jgi:hypothetical protein
MLQFFEMLPFKEPETSQACCFHSEAFVTAPAHNSNGRIRRNLLIESESFCQYSHLVLLTKKFTGKETTSTAPHVIIVILKRLFFLSGLFS